MKKQSAGNYNSGDWRIMRMISGSWIVWNVKTQTRSARECPNTKWFSNFSEVKQFVMEVK